MVSTFSNLLGNNGSSSRFVREWDESSVGYFDAWVLAGDGLTSLYKTGSSNLDQNHGYELVQQNPTTYTNEFIFKQSIYVIISIWLVSFIIWTAIVLNSDLKINSLMVKYCAYS